jgi:O-6-methylguanine DNA methyltransferase
MRSFTSGTTTEEIPHERFAMITEAITWFATVPSPVGPLVLTKRGEALVGLSMRSQANAPGPDRSSDAFREDPSRFSREASQLAEYFAGARVRFDLKINLDGTPFQRLVWEALLRIPYAQTVSYGALARAVGRPGASRAVGAANGRNPIAIVVPCHRVIAADGTLGGYASGVERKSWLIDWERRLSLSPVLETS